MITCEQIETFRRSPAAFRESLLIDADGGPKPFGEVMDPWQRTDFESLDAGWIRAAGLGTPEGPSRGYLERPRGHSKTADLATMATWALAFSPRQLAGVLAAVDRQQARLLRTAIDRIVRLNSWLAQVLDVQHSVIINKRTGSELEILSSDTASSFGRTPSFVLCDEMTHWSSEELWGSLLSSAAKRRDCLLLVIANAGFTQSWPWAVREAVRQDHAWYFSRLEGPVATWLDAEKLDEQRRLLPDGVYRRLWLNEWSSGAGDAIQVDDIEAAVTQTGPMEGNEVGYQFIGGLDLGVSRDHSAFVVTARHYGHCESRPAEPKPKSRMNDILVDLGFESPEVEDNEPEHEHFEGTLRTRLAHCQSWKPPRGGKMDLQLVEDAILAAHYRFGLKGVFYDPHQAEHMAQRLVRRGVRMIAIPFTQSALQAMASTLVEGFSSRIFDLYRHDLLLQQLVALRIVERANGFRLESPRGVQGHGDIATAFALSTVGCRRLRQTPTLTRPLLHEGITFQTIEKVEAAELGVFWDLQDSLTVDW